MAGGYYGLENLITRMLWAILIMIPLAIWKVVDILIWLIVKAFV